MTLGIREASPDDRTDWTAFVASRPEGDVLQAWAWGEAGAGERGEHWRRLIVVDAAGHTRGVAQVLDRSTLLGRTILYVPHGPLWDREATDAAEILARLIVGLRTHARERRGVVLKLDPRASGDAAQTAALARVLEAGGARPASHDLQAPSTRILDLTAGDDPVASWSKDARAEARRAEREGTVTRVDRVADPAVLDTFHALLSATSERAGFHARSRRFLDALARPLAAAGDWFVVLAEHDGRPLAGAIAARTGDRAFYLYAASTRDPELVAKRGPYAVMAALQRSLREAGTRTLDLWGVREADDASADPAWEGFSLFKRRFGGEPLRHPGTFDLVIDARWNQLRNVRERLRDARS
jgi:lipid II:glycine glycyltransferase (peptidoglycan interpeptide bridge formation enzyme)